MLDLKKIGKRLKILRIENNLAVGYNHIMSIGMR